MTDTPTLNYFTAGLQYTVLWSKLYLTELLTLTLGEDVSVEVFLCIGAAWWQVAELTAVYRRQGVDH